MRGARLFDEGPAPAVPPVIGRLSMTRKHISVAVASVIFLAPSVVQAYPVEGRTAEVSYTDLDLTSPVGVQQLDRRIRAAATRVCGPRGSRGVEDRLLFDACYKEALADGRVKMDLALGKTANARLAASRTIRVGPGLR
jgi:UrcA family protein